MVKDPAAIRARIMRLLTEGVLDTLDGTTIPVSAQSILVHSDTPGAIALGGIIREAVTAAGAEIVPLSCL